jgi:hypothetical protein
MTNLLLEVETPELQPLLWSSELQSGLVFSMKARRVPLLSSAALLGCWSELLGMRLLSSLLVLEEALMLACLAGHRLTPGPLERNCNPSSSGCS